MRRLGKAMEDGEYPVIGYAPNGAAQFGSMRMKVIEEKMVDGYKVKVLPAGYAEGAYPRKMPQSAPELNYVSICSDEPCTRNSKKF